jgi:hypothetical protein
MPKKPTQAEKFKKAAKEAEADQDEAAFKKRLEKITKPEKAPKGK